MSKTGIKHKIYYYSELLVATPLFKSPGRKLFALAQIILTTLKLLPRLRKADLREFIEAAKDALRIATGRKTRQRYFFYPDSNYTIDDVTRLESLHNKFAGERLFAMGNGPSLNKLPLDKLKNEFTFGVNRINLLFDRIDWRPTFYTAFDVRVVPDNAEEINQIDVEYKFFDQRYKSLLSNKPNHYWHVVKGLFEGFDSCFDEEVIYSGFGGGGTILVIAIELAFYMGFDPIYVIGADVDYKILPDVKQEGPDAFGDGVLLNLESTADNDPNHFDPRYFGKGKKWHNPNTANMLKGFAGARASIEKRGRRIYNATPGGKLDCIERVNFLDLF